MFTNTTLFLIYIKLTAHGVRGAWSLHVVKLVEEENNCKPELLPSMRKMAELCVLEKIYEKLTVIVRSVLPVIHSVSFLVKKGNFRFITFLYLQCFLYVHIKLTAYGVTGAWPLHVAKVAEVENNCKPELLPSMSKMVELCVREKTYKRSIAIPMVVLLVILYHFICMR